MFDNELITAWFTHGDEPDRPLEACIRLIRVPLGMEEEAAAFVKRTAGHFGLIQTNEPARPNGFSISTDERAFTNGRFAAWWGGWEIEVVWIEDLVKLKLPRGTSAVITDEESGVRFLIDDEGNLAFLNEHGRPVVPKEVN